MRIVSFIIAGLLILAGGGCLVSWSDGARLDETFLLFAGFGLVPLIGGALLLRYAWKDRGGKGGGE